MPRNNDLKKILLIGSGPIVIGQGCEFDYSGVQACKALREEGYQVVLVNSNPATIMTDPEFADRTYVEPITDEVIEATVTQVVKGGVLVDLGMRGFVPASQIRRQPVGNLEEIKKYNSITVDAEGKITFFEEKPKNPTSTITGIALYYYPKSTIALIKQYIAEGNNPDQPGRLVQWLYPRTPVYTWHVPGLWFDIGSKETLEEANQIFAKF